MNLDKLAESEKALNKYNENLVNELEIKLSE
jgi:hypothetical protein